MRIAVLGPLEVHHDGTPVVFRRGIPRILLSALVVRRRDVITFESLIDHVWDADSPANPANALHTQIAYLRRTIPDLPLRTMPSGYVLDVTPDDVDCDRFETLAEAARADWQAQTAPSVRRAHDAAVEALALWRGPAHADVADRPFARGAAARLEELRLVVEELRIDALLATGQPASAAHDLARLVEQHPLRERFHEQLIVAFYRTGRQADALRVYARARALLAEELGVDPGPGLRALEHAVLDHADELRWTPLPDDHVVEVVPSPSSTVPHPVRPPARPLPNPPTALVGRDAELERLGVAIGSHRLVTLVGPGGAGKTRLAIELARRSADRRPTCFVDLSVVPPDDDPTGTILHALGISRSEDDDLGAALTAGVGGSPTLLVLDTCEHVVDGVRDVVLAVLACGEEVSVVTTSRRPLALAGELAWPVPPLALPEGTSVGMQAPPPAALQLYAERARAVRPDFVLDEANVADVAAICEAVDGLPLAIELAAAQSDVLSPAAIRARLPDRFSLLVGRDPSSPPRQRTLSATIDWSLHLVAPRERRFLEAVAELAGSFDIAAAAAVDGCDEQEALRMIAELVRQSVVAVEDVDDGRYRVLDSVRERVLAAVPAEDRQRAQRRLAEHFAALAESSFFAVRSRAQPEWMRRFRLDEGNVRVALAWSFSPDGDEVVGARLASALAWVWTSEGRLVEARDAVERAAGVAAAPADVRARALLGIGLLAAPRGDLELAVQVCEESVELSRSIDDDFGVADGLLTLGVAHWGLGALDAAALAHDEAIVRFLSGGDPYGALVARILRARTELDRGGLDTSEELLDVALDEARQTGGDHVIGLALLQCARLALARGDHHVATLSATEARLGFDRISYVEGVMSALHLEGRARSIAGDPSAAHATHVAAARLARTIGHPAGLCEAMESIAGVLADAGDPERATAAVLHAARIRARRGLAVRETDAPALAGLVERLRLQLGDRWSTIERAVRVASSDAFVDELLAHDGRAAEI